MRHIIAKYAVIRRHRLELDMMTQVILSALTLLTLSARSARLQRNAVAYTQGIYLFPTFCHNASAFMA